MADIGQVGNFLAGGASALDSLFGFSAKRQENAQKRLMDKQQNQWKEQQQILAEQQLAQWNRENEYNDPTNYYKRLFAGAEANGINPKALVGDSAPGAVGVSQSKNVPGSTSVPGVGGVQQQSIAGGMSTVLDSMRQRAEIANIESQTNKNNAEAGLSTEQSKTESVERGYLGALQNYYIASENLVKEQALTEPVKRAVERIDAICKQTENRIAEFNHTLNKTFSFREREMGLSKSYQEISESLSRVDLNTNAGLHYKASIGLMKIQGGLFEAQAGYYDSMSKLNDVAYKYQNATFVDRVILSTEQALQSQYQTSILNKQDSVFYAQFALSSLEDITSSLYNVASIFQRQESSKVQKASVQDSYERGQETRRHNKALEQMFLKLIMSQIGKR